MTFTEDWDDYMRARHARRRMWPWVLLGVVLTVGGWAAVVYGPELMP